MDEFSENLQKEVWLWADLCLRIDDLIDEIESMIGED